MYSRVFLKHAYISAADLNFEAQVILRKVLTTSIGELGKWQLYGKFLRFLFV